MPTVTDDAISERLTAAVAGVQPAAVKVFALGQHLGAFRRQTGGMTEGWEKPQRWGNGGYQKRRTGGKADLCNSAIDFKEHGQSSHSILMRCPKMLPDV
jgi:hypothetical protein